MKNMSSSQKNLYLAAKLFELAAEFTDAELQAMLQEQARQPVPSALQAAIRALMQLHRESGSIRGLSRSVIDVAGVPELPSRNRSPQAASLIELFEDRVAFPSVADIVDVLHVEPKPKESRDRYISRVSKMIEEMNPQARKYFIDELGRRLNTRPDSFISKWSKLIKEM